MRPSALALGLLLASLVAGCSSMRRPLDSAGLFAAPWSRVVAKYHDPQVVVWLPNQGEGAGMGSRNWGRCTHPFLTSYSSNRIMLTYAIGGDVDDGLTTIAAVDWPAWSDDGGLNWTLGRSPLVWVDGEPKAVQSARAGDKIVWHSGYRMGRIQAAEGAVILYGYVCRGRGQVGGVNAFEGEAVWTDDGVVMYGPLSAMLYTPRPLSTALYVNPGGVVLADGSCLITAYAMEDGAQSGTARWSLYAFRSMDGGRTFAHLAVIAEPQTVLWGVEGANEADLVRLPSGALLCAARTAAMPSSGRGGILLARSEDNGLTWSLVDSGIVGVSPSLEVLDNGVVAMSYGRPDAHIVFSDDEGRTWRKHVQLNRNGETSTGYVSMVQVDSNRLLLAYDLWSRLHEGKRVDAIVVQYVDVALEGQPVGQSARSNL